MCFLYKWQVRAKFLMQSLGTGLRHMHSFICSCVESCDDDPNQVHFLDKIASCVLLLSQFPQSVKAEVKSFDL